MHLKNNTLLQGGKYKIERFIASGGFGCTYEAYHTLLDMRVALKEFFVSDFCNRDEKTGQVSVATKSKVELIGKLKKKFMDEARALYKMKHPGIVRVIDVFEENGTAYYAMEYIDGQSLSDVVKKRGKLPEAEAVGYIRQVAEALKYVHSLNRLHLDIKPGNIMLGKDGKAVLIDFGASKHYDDETGENTSTLLGINTRGYAPVEQVNQSFKSFSPATDIYALGATLYKLLTGITPPPSTLLHSEEATLAPLPSTVSPATRKAVESAMQLLRKHRPQTIDAWMQMLSGVASNDKDRDSEHDEQTVVVEVTEESSSQHKQPKGNQKVHEWVDLGLSVKWATCNIGADRPEDYGDYFAWGETRPKSTYNWSNCFDCLDGKYDGRWGTYRLSGQTRITPTSGHDTARENWCGSWRMPTDEEFEELCDENKCDWTWTSQGGHKGYLVTSKINGNSIFLPAAGWRNGTAASYVGESGYYCSGTLSSSNSIYARTLRFNSSGHRTGDGGGRCYGRSVRPVTDVDVVVPEPTPASKPKPKSQPAQKPNPQPKPVRLSVWKWIISGVAAAIIISFAIGQQEKNESPDMGDNDIIAANQINSEDSQYQSTTGIINGYDWVDLGLSVKWATKNVDADSPSDYGDYFAWGETRPKSSYDWINCFDCLDDKGNSWGIYKIGGKTSISPTSGHDTARENWGGSWRMPTDAEMDELWTKCKWKWTSQGGHNGYKVTGPNGNSIFLPAAGWRYGTGRYDVGESGLYWSSTLSSSDSYCARGRYFNSSGHYTIYFSRSSGRSIRPVTD